MLPNVISQGTVILSHAWSVPQRPPLVARFLGKFVVDILPAALASAIGGFLLTHYQVGQSAPPRPAVEAASPASAEVIQMVRDEHAAILDYLQAQSAAEKSRLVVEDGASARAASEAKAAAEAKLAVERSAAEAALRRVAAAAAAAKPALPRAKPVTATAAVAATRAAQAPLVIAQAQPNENGASGRLARDPDSLLAKTLDFKDHVVAATRYVVSAIGDVFASVGDRLSGTRQFNS